MLLALGIEMPISLLSASKPSAQLPWIFSRSRATMYFFGTRMGYRCVRRFRQVESTVWSMLRPHEEQMRSVAARWSSELSPDPALAISAILLAKRAIDEAGAYKSVPLKSRSSLLPQSDNRAGALISEVRRCFVRRTRPRRARRRSLNSIPSSTVVSRLSNPIKSKEPELPRHTDSEVLCYTDSTTVSHFDCRYTIIMIDRGVGRKFQALLKD